jgi:peptidylprolyl isomerase
MAQWRLSLQQSRKTFYMTDAKSGDTVRIHYTGTLEDGSTFDSSDGRDPLEFKLGSGQVIPGFDKAVTGMSVGEAKTVEIPPEDAYGEHNPNGRQSFPRANIPDDVPLDIGTRLQMQTPEGQAVQVVVAEVGEAEVILDANHPLAGKALTFAIELVEIV